MFPQLRYTCKTIFHKDWNGDIRTGVDVAAIILDSPSFKTPLQMDIGGRKVCRVSVTDGINLFYSTPVHCSASPIL